MPASARIATLIHLLYISISTANLTIQKIPLDNNNGWRCGRRIITQKAIQSATEDAVIHVADTAGLRSEEIEYPYPERYDGFFGFQGEDGPNLLWPIVDTVPEHIPVSLGEKSLGSFLVLQACPRNTLKSIAVVEKISENNKYRKCIWERDLSDMDGKFTVNAFRCPKHVFPIEMVEEQVRSAMNHVIKHRYSTPRDYKYPAAYDGS
ncbi:hypothetical protein K3495_g12557 [Podosphaera aphanis]|nr:hypothetical protein K3495_g12557 [Podosphaera aphanis]